MEKTLALFIPIAFCICVTVCIYFISRFRYQAISKLGGAIPRNPYVRTKWKKIGVIIIGFALGLITVGAMFYNGVIEESKWNGLFIVGIVSLFVGLSMMAADKMKGGN